MLFITLGLLLIFTIISKNQCEVVLTGIDDVHNLLQNEVKVIEFVEKYIEDERERLRQIEAFVSKKNSNQLYKLHKTFINFHNNNF
jgi:hypothetical protein